jgi:alkylation response protein AidB-like acyl-CoA dehydrogenase
MQMRSGRRLLINFIREGCLMETSRNFYLENDDLRFQIDNIPWAELLPLVEYDQTHPDAIKSVDEAKAQYAEVLSSMGEFIAQKIAPLAHEIDKSEPRLEGGEVIESVPMRTCLNGLIGLGITQLPLSRHVGGMNMPWVIASVVYELLSRADVSVSTCQGFYAGIGMALQLYSLEEDSFVAQDGVLQSTRFDAQIRKIAQGEEFGAMVLTEPGAGSDLSRINTKATQTSDGTWQIEGQKIWITSGHGEHHVVLARSEDSSKEPGLKGLSLFYVPAHIEHDGKRVRNIELGGLEKKMGQHSSVTITVNYNQSYAELIGQRGHGFRYMLLLMNNARLFVGFEGVGLCESAYRMAKSYAEERVSMGKPIAQHEMIADYLDDMDTMICGMRALNFDAAFHEEMSSRMRALMKIKPPKDKDEREEREKQIRFHKRKVRMATPLVKYMGSEQAVHMARMTMQIMGGVGYMSEYGAEKLLRDALVMPIYEGTSQIQALMVLKDHLQHAMRNPAKFLAGAAKVRIDSVRARDPLDAALARVKSLYFSGVQTILTQIVADKFGDLRGKPLANWKASFLQSWDPKKDFSFGLLHAERLTLIASYMAIAKVLVRQAHDAKSTPHAQQRRDLAERFIERAEPKCRGVLGEIEATRRSFFKSLIGADRAKIHRDLAK